MSQRLYCNSIDGSLFIEFMDYMKNSFSFRTYYLRKVLCLIKTMDNFKHGTLGLTGIDLLEK